MTTPETSFYVAGGTLPRSAPSYVERNADAELLAALQGGEFCYVLTARQMGKSSLMVRTAARLQQEGVTVAVLDLTAIGQNLTAEQWYDGLLNQLGMQLNLQDELDDYWLDHPRLGPLQRFMAALQAVILPYLPSPNARFVLFIDEIDAVRSLPFSTDEFFAAIRECFNRRTRDLEFQRLTFCLLGVAAPSDLIRDTRMTPFNIGRRIDLTDFTDAEATPLVQGLGLEPRGAAQVLARILHWTGGHPYLSQRLCRAVSQANQGGNPATGVRTPQAVDRLCEALFLASSAREQDDNLIFVRERLLRGGADLAALLDLYRQVWEQRRVRDEDTNPLCGLLKLAGAVRAVGGCLRVRNRIYARVFDREWVRAHMPDAEVRRQRAAFRRGLTRAATLASVVVVGMTALAGAAVAQAGRADAASRTAELNRQAADSRANDLNRLARRLDQELVLKRKALASESQARQVLAKALGQAKTERLLAQAAAHRARQAQALEQFARLRARKALAREEQQHRLANDRLVRLNVGSALRLAEEGDYIGALPWLANAVRLEPPGSKKSALHRERFAAALRNCPRLLQSWYEPSGGQRATFSPDGTRVAISSSGGTARVWSASTGQAIGRVLQHGPVSEIVFDPGGRRVVTADGKGTAQVWDAESGLPIGAPMRETGPLFTVQFSPDGKRVLTAGSESARLWDSSTGAPAGPRWGLDTRERPGLVAARFSPNGSRVLTVGNEGCRVWNSVTGAATTPLLPRGFCLSGTAWSPDSRYVALAFADQPARVWNAENGAPASPELPPSEYALCFSPDGQRLAVGTTKNNGTVAQIFDALTWKPVGADLLHHGRIQCLAFSPDGQLLAGGANDGTVHIWNVGTGQLYCPPLRQVGQVTQVAFSPEGHRLLTTSMFGPVRLWDFTRPKAPGILPWNPLKLRRVATSPDGNRLLLESEDGQVRLWETTTGKGVVLPKPLGLSLSCGAFSRDGRRVLTAFSDGSVRFWEASGGRPLTPFVRQQWVAECADFSPDGRRVACGSADPTSTASYAWLVNGATGQPLGTPIRVGDPLGRVVFSPDGQRLLTGTGRLHDARGEARIWDSRTGRPLTPPMSSGSPLHGVTFSPDGNLVATASENGVARVWEATTGRPITPLLRHTAAVYGVAFSPDNRRLVTGGYDDKVRVWEVRTGRSLLPPLACETPFAVWFSPDGRRILATSMGKAARWWDAATGELIGSTALECMWVFSRDGQRWVTADIGGTRVRIWETAPDPRPVRDLELLAQLFVGDSQNGEAVDPADLQEPWQTLRTKYPQSFTPSPADLQQWHTSQLEIRLKALDTAINAALGSRRWSDAVHYLNQYQELTPWDGNIAYFRAVCYLASENYTAYRHECEGIYSHLTRSRAGKEEGLSALFRTTWTCALAPDALKDYGPVLALARQQLASDPQEPLYIENVGGLLYRSGRYEEALQLFQRAASPVAGPKTSPTYRQFFQAMAHYRLGHSEEARNVLAEAVQRAELELAAKPPWNRQLTLNLLRQEAEALILPEKR